MAGEGTALVDHKTDEFLVFVQMLELVVASGADFLFHLVNTVINLNRPPVERLRLHRCDGNMAGILHPEQRNRRKSVKVTEMCFLRFSSPVVLLSSADFLTE